MNYVVMKRISFMFKNSEMFSDVAEVVSEVPENAYVEFETENKEEALQKCKNINLEQLKIVQKQIERAKIEIADYMILLNRSEEIRRQLIGKI